MRSLPLSTFALPQIALQRGKNQVQALLLPIPYLRAADDLFPPGLSGGALLATVIIVPVAAVIIFIAIVLLATPKLRQRVFPHRDRESFAPSMSTRF